MGDLILRENPFEQLVPGNGVPEDAPGHLVGLGELLDRGQVKVGEQHLN